MLPPTAAPRAATCGATCALCSRAATRKGVWGAPLCGPACAEAVEWTMEMNWGYAALTRALARLCAAKSGAWCELSSPKAPEIRVEMVEGCYFIGCSGGRVRSAASALLAVELLLATFGILLVVAEGRPCYEPPSKAGLS